MIDVIPAILPKNFSELEEAMDAVAGLVPLVQIDITDGRFVSNTSWPYSGVASGRAASYDENFAEILAEHADFPFLNELDFEVDLMVANPAEVWRDWVRAGAKRLIIHAESLPNAAELATFLKIIRAEVPADESFLHIDIGVALNPDTPNSVLEPLLVGSVANPALADFVQFMGIARIGFQGQLFDERVLGKISDLRARFPKVTMSVDGGVNVETAPRLVSAGANRLAIGSALFKEEDILLALNKIYSAIGEKEIN